MPNTLTRLYPDLYAGLNVVSRELVGFIPAATRFPGNERAAVGQDIVIPIAPAANVSNIAPAMTTPEPTDQTVGNTTITVTKSRAAEFGFVGEERLGLDNGPGYLSLQAQMFAEGLRSLTNEIEADVAAEAASGVSRAVGTPGTTPFASGVGDSAQVRKVLDDNGAPISDRYLIGNTTMGAALRTNTQLTKANEAADNTMLRQGVLTDLHGHAIGESGQAVSHTAGDASGFLVNGAAVEVGATAIPVDTGTGTFNAGDVITIAGDPNQYVVTADVSGGNLTIAAPGLVLAPADNAAITRLGDYEANVAFSMSALQLIVRPPALPEEGDMALDRMLMVDARSGLTFEVSVYPGYRKVRYEVACSWGQKQIKPAHGALLLG